MITINWVTRVITIPQSYLTQVVGTLYELDTDQFRLDLKALEASEEGQVYPDTHRHNTEVTVAGTTFARTIEIINGYSITFENGSYSVRLVGSNNNLFDIQNNILNQNTVQVIPGNSAGLIVREVGSGVTEQDKDDIADKVWDELIADHSTADSTGQVVSAIKTVVDQNSVDISDLDADIVAIAAAIADVDADVGAVSTNVQSLIKILVNRMRIDTTANTLTIYDDDKATPLYVFDLKNAAGAPSALEPFERDPQ